MKIRLKVIIILILILFLIINYNSKIKIINTFFKNNEQTTNENVSSKTQDNVNLPANILNGSYIVYDENYVYYINQEDYNKLYKIDMEGKKSELIYKGNVAKLFIMDNNIYFINKIIDENNAIKNELCSIEKDGANLKRILTENEIISYSIFENAIYYIAPNEKQADYIIPYNIHNLYSCDMNGNKKQLVFENVASNINSSGIFPILIDNKKMYFGIFNLNAGMLEYEYVKYDISSGDYSVISKFAPQAVSENTMFFSCKNEFDLQCIYSMNVSYEHNALNTIYKSNDTKSSIMKIITTNEYLFAMIIDDIYDEKLNLNIINMKHDGSEIVKIMQMNMPSFGSYFPNYMQIVNDKLIIYKYDENWNPSIIVTDFYGNILNWDL